MPPGLNRLDDLVTTAGRSGLEIRVELGEIEAAPGGADFALAVLAESVAIATAAGHAPSEPFLASTKTIMTKKDSPQAPSMIHHQRSPGLASASSHVHSPWR